MKIAKIKYFGDWIVFFMIICYLCPNPQKTTAMKRVLFAICLLLLCVCPAEAGRRNRHAIGPMLGYQTAQLSYFRGNIKSDFSQNFTAGVFARFYRGKVYLQPELLYFNTSNLFDVTLTTLGGVQVENHTIPQGARLEVTLNSMNLQLPVLVGFELINLHLLRLRVHAGPTANYVLNSRVFVSYTAENHLQTAPVVESFKPRNIAWGFQAGCGLDVFNRIYFDINFNFGLTSMYKRLCETQLGEHFDFSNLEESRLNMFMVTVGVKLF